MPGSRAPHLHDLFRIRDIARSLGARTEQSRRLRHILDSECTQSRGTPGHGISNSIDSGPSIALRTHAQTKKRPVRTD